MPVAIRTTLLLGFDPKTALAVARPLHRRGVRVVVATHTVWETPLRSRAIAAYVALPLLDRPAAEFGAALLRAIDEHDVDLVIPLTDRALQRLGPHQAALRARVTLACPPPALVALALDKTATARAAAPLGVPMPAEFATPGAGGPPPPFPLFAKTRDRGAEGRHLMRRLETADELRALLAAAPAGAAGVLLQEILPGDDVGLAVLRHAGRTVASFQYRALRRITAAAGQSTLLRSEPVDPRFAACAERLLAALNWEGLAQLDFMHDPVSGRFALLEINARFWGTTGAAVAAGVDFPLYVWQLAHGETPAPPPAYRAGLRVRWLEGDVRRLLDLGKNRAPGRWREALRIAADFRPGVRGLVWSWRDPWPAVEAVWRLVQPWLTTRWRRVFGGGPP